MKEKNKWIGLALSGWLVAAVSAQALVIYGDPADYQTQHDQALDSLGHVSAYGGSSETLRVFTEETDGFFMESGRPIYQFDLSVLDQPLASAIFAVEMLSIDTNMDYAIEVWGTDANRSGPLMVGDDGAAGQYASSAYQQAAPGALADQNSSVGAKFLDITGYLNARYEDYAAGGDAWVYLRLQPSYGFSFGSGVNASFSYASADHVNEAYRPRIETTPIPEPAFAALLAGLAAGIFLYRRLRGVRQG